MEFRLDRFYSLNRKAIIWIVLFGLIYLLRDFFTLIFLTFVISFFAFPLIQTLHSRLRLPQRTAVVLVYSVFLCSYLAMYLLAVPNVIRQANHLRKNLPQIEAKLNELRLEYAERHTNVAWLLKFESQPFLVSTEDVRKEDWLPFLQRLLSDQPASVRVQQLFPLETLLLIKEQIDAPVEEPPMLPGDFPPQALRTRIAGQLNSLVLPDPAFYSPQAFPDVAANLSDYPEIHRLLLNRANEGLNPVATQRLNRRLLEHAFPEISRVRANVSDQDLARQIEEWKQELQEYSLNFALYFLQFFGTSLLAILFSFLIILDYQRLRTEVQNLANSRLRDFFLEASQPAIKFALSVGYGFQSIVIIAFFTAVMIAIALAILQVPSIAFLTVVAFVTSLVPVVGVIFEVVPILLVALNARGPEIAFWTGIALGVIHFFVGYVVAPVVFGRQFKINAVAVVFILFIGHQLAGVWGMILGVPIANYLLRDLLAVPPPEPAPVPPPPPETI